MSAQTIAPSIRQGFRAATMFAGTAAAALSIKTQTDLGLSIGWTSSFAWLLPATVVVFEVSATLLYFAVKEALGAGEGKDPALLRALKSARTSAVVAVGLSWGLNTLWHVLHPSGAEMWVTLVVTSIPNIALALLLHMLMSLPTGDPRNLLGEAVEDPRSESAEKEPIRVSDLPPVRTAGGKPDRGATGKEVLGVQPRQIPSVAKKLPEGTEIQPVVAENMKDVAERRRRPNGEGARLAVAYVTEPGRSLKTVTATELAREYGSSNRYWRLVLADVRAQAVNDQIPELIAG